MQLEIIAFAAGLISSTAAIPQIVRMIRTRKTSAVSTYMFAMKIISSALWVAFGFAAVVWSVVFWNAISLILCSTVIVMKYRIIGQKEAEKKALESEVMAVATLRVAGDNAAAIAAPVMTTTKRPALRLVYSAPASAQA